MTAGLPARQPRLCVPVYPFDAIGRAQAAAWNRPRAAEGTGAPQAWSPFPAVHRLPPAAGVFNLKEPTMRNLLSFFSLSAVAGAAMAVMPVGPYQINISPTGVSSQVSTVSGTTMTNSAVGLSQAHQNMASNFGVVNINGRSVQQLTASGGSVTNTAGTPSVTALQNISTNAGNVNITGSGNSTQQSFLTGANVSNTAAGGLFTQAYQNLASNNGQINVNAVSSQVARVTGSSMINESLSTGTVANQNASSNYGVVNINAGSNQETNILGGAVVRNRADTLGSDAVQNMASNHSGGGSGVNINALSDQQVRIDGGSVSNTATGGLLARAAQNLASNHGVVNIGGPSTQYAFLTGATMTNLANGAGARATQNMSSNFAAPNYGF